MSGISRGTLPLLITISNSSQIFDIQHFREIFNNAHMCSNGGRLEFISDVSPPVGLFHHNVLRCSKCFKETLMTNFPAILPVESEQQEPNKRLCIATATNGIGYVATKGILSSLGLSITTEKTFLQQLHKSYDDFHDFAKKKFQLITEDIKYRNNKQNEITDITISLDGTWKKRGHTSNYGVVFITDVQSGCCIDYEVLSLKCENYNGSSKSMEKEGVIRLFQRSLSNDLRYKQMVCDGDASAYEAVKYFYIKQQQHLREIDMEMEEGANDISDAENEVSSDMDSDAEDEEPSDIDVDDEEDEDTGDIDVSDEGSEEKDDDDMETEGKSIALNDDLES
ncbi:unnamed protein product [Didymodactylos carnosus]|uniref:Mutator-like transposase domain-containing protein n=1 Tax=Didymodactylos carnosus TaxID=1234261 RepID=A0A8S2E5T8_9BILA|nr:unnamed protein product [Didymodactylos carnosus]CAF3893719.1 unnamed protein product [Didymodactylos carnosus]